ncbi:FKBP-type peptidyl-prolyl cis-trans isomerase [Mucilaginibacter jinjuensis]|uniref:Peptidyl-prolyl cis-trans isomerase n=1 Tax=Mucilaginibacter jinjuensis TaxID=1176721 RepID=A0ABY7T864_9SPHI|nr:FKBP-type peptidyl-prolyl cis-trans isomerase [Mucilaginibacter jinjuensis]WCT12601.1 FKBP-type peptidyl-prolyl cis-trans isomerase [Mucilaginibacter jinjuensis]
MKKYLLLLFVAVIGISSCKKSSDDSAAANAATAAAQAVTDDNAIKNYLTVNNITATKDASGLYYQIVTPGAGAYPTASSIVTVNYTGALLDGTVFDTGLSFQTAISANANIIQGWKTGIPFINKGGRIKLFIPSAMGYGATAQTKIPANSVLIFTIDLIGLN